MCFFFFFFFFFSSSSTYLLLEKAAVSPFFTPDIVIKFLSFYKFDKNSMLLQIAFITFLQNEIFSHSPLLSSLPLAYTSTPTSTRLSLLYNII
jgi:hypothetical protein